MSSDADTEVEESSEVVEAEVVPVDDETAEVDGAESTGLQEFGPITVDGTELDPYGDAAEDPAVGLAAPVVSGQTFDGSEVVIGGPTENPTMILFVAHWCPHCQAEVPEVIALDAAGGIPDGVDVVAVSTAADSSGDNFPPSEWLEGAGWPWPTLADDEAGTAIISYGGNAFPFSVVLDTDGTVLARRSGQATGSETTAFIEAALANADAAAG